MVSLGCNKRNALSDARRTAIMPEARGMDSEKLECPKQLERLRVELDETRAWCVGLEKQLAELRALLALLGAGAR